MELKSHDCRSDVRFQSCDFLSWWNSLFLHEKFLTEIFPRTSCNIHTFPWWKYRPNTQWLISRMCEIFSLFRKNITTNIMSNKFFLVFSSPLSSPGSLSFVFTVVVVASEDGRMFERRGVCTGWLDATTGHLQNYQSIPARIDKMSLGDNHDKVKTFIYDEMFH